MKEQFIGVALARVALAYSLNRKSSQSQYYTCTAARCWCSVHLAALALQSDAMKTDENHQVSCQKKRLFDCPRAARLVQEACSKSRAELAALR